MIKKLLSGPVLINAVVFQALWFACVIGGAKGILWPAMLLMLALLVWQMADARRHPSDVKLMLLAIILGLLVDSIWINFGLMEFSDKRPIAWLSPIWIVMMWAGFALTINHSMAWLAAHPLLPALMGIIGGPMAYYAGLKLGAVKYLIDPIIISALLAVVWASALTMLVRLSQSSKAPDSI